MVILQSKATTGWAVTQDSARIGSDVDRAFDYDLERLVRSLTAEGQQDAC